MPLTEKVGPGIRAKELTAKVTKLGREGKWQPALLVLEEARDGGLLDLVLCNAAVTACARSQAWQASLSLLQTMSQGRVNPLPDRITMNSALNACATVAHWEKALHLLELQSGRRGLQPNTVSFNTVINACAKSEQWQEALHLLYTMEHDKRGPRPDLFSFNTAMAACEGSGRWRTCVLLLESSIQRGLQPDVVSYNTILSSARGEWQRALSFLEDLISGEGPKANIVSLGAALAACEQSGQWEAALSLMQWARSAHLAPHGVVRVLLGCMRVAQRWQEALQIQQELRAWDGMTFGCVLGVLEKSCSWQVALNSILPDMQKRSVRPESHAYSALLGACTAWAKTGQEVEAAACGARLLQRAKDAGEANDVVVEAMLCLLEQAELWQEALNLLGEERRRPPNLIHYATVTSACAKGQRWEICLELLRQLDQDSATPDMVLRSTAISACERSFQWQDALSILAAMLEDLITPDSVAYSSTMLACNKAGRWDLSLKLLEKALRPDYKPDDAISVLCAGLGAYAESRDWQQAIERLLQIELLVPRAQAKHWLQDAQSTAMFAALQPSTWEQCLALLPGEAELASIGCAVRACAIGRNWHGALQLFAAEIDFPNKREKVNLWSATHLACQAADTPQPLMPELNQLALPL